MKVKGNNSQLPFQCCCALYEPRHWGIKLSLPCFTGSILKRKVHMLQSTRDHRQGAKHYSHSGLPSKSMLPRWNISPDTGSTHQISVSELCSTVYSPVYKELRSCHCRAMCFSADTPKSIPQRLVKMLYYIYTCPLLKYIEKKHKIQSN